MALKYSLKIKMALSLSLYLIMALAIATSSFASGQSPSSAVQLKVFPGAEGFGTDTPAGRGGKILKVTNLNNSGPGSLRAAINTTGSRIIVFEVGGTIHLSTDLEIKNAHVTLAGQTAPSPGIMLKGAGIKVMTHDVLIQHIRIRTGDALNGPNPSNRDALQVLGPYSHDVVIDHISASWAIDENGSTWYPVQNITFSNSIFSEGLNVSMHPKGPHSKGFLIGKFAKNISLIGNMMVHNTERNPRILADSSVIFVNNLVYNSGSSSFMVVGSNFGPSLVTAIGNVFINGPDTPSDSKAIKVDRHAGPATKIFSLNNQASGKILTYSSNFDPRVTSPPVWFYPMTIRDTIKLESWVLVNVGARPADRDGIDDRLVNEVKKRTGKIINSPNQVGGWPKLPSTKRPFNIPENPNGDDNKNGYTNVEEVLHRMAAEVEGKTLN